MKGKWLQLSPPDVRHLCGDGLLARFTGRHGKAPQGVEKAPHGDQAEGAALLWELCELGPPGAEREGKGTSDGLEPDAELPDGASFLDLRAEAPPHPTLEPHLSVAMS